MGFRRSALQEDHMKRILSVSAILMLTSCMTVAGKRYWFYPPAVSEIHCQPLRDAKVVEVFAFVGDFSSRPLPGATITLSPNQSVPIKMTSDLDGKASIHTEAGEYALTVELSGFHEHRKVLDLPPDNECNVNIYLDPDPKRIPQ
jgi:hypothetical protein